MRQLVFIHGRAQEHKNADTLKAEWIDALREGLAKSALTLPIGESDIRFPYYGDTLFDMVNGRSAGEAAEVVIRGTDDDVDQKRFTLEVLEEIRKRANISDAQLAEAAGDEVVRRGPLNWEWVQAILKAVDRFVPHGSGASIALFTNDVYQYLKDSSIREEIEEGIVEAITPGVETVVVAHSLGTVVSYNLLRREGRLLGWKTPLYVTVGAPLAITAIRKTLKGFAPMRCPECVTTWFNAMDERDVVALYPLDAKCFPLNPAEPAIENKTDVRNRTSNRHGIAGYLDDREVARRIFEGLTA